MRVFFDTNVVLDIILNRQGCDEAKRLLEYIRRDEYSRAYLSFLSVANIAYVLRKMPIAEIHKKIRAISKVFTIFPCSDILLTAAERIESPDYEDSIQIACAQQERCDIIVTNNKSHFDSYSYLPVLTPQEFAAE